MPRKYELFQLVGSAVRVCGLSCTGWIQISKCQARLLQVMRILVKASDTIFANLIAHQQSLRFTAEVFDDFGLGDSVTAAIDAIDANDAPSSTSTTYVLAENPAKGSLIGKFVAESIESTEKLDVQIIDSDCPFAFDRLSNKLVVQNSTTFDFETNPVIHCVLMVTDDALLPRSIYTTVSIQLNDVNEMPAILTEQRGFIRENAAKGQFVMTIQAIDFDIYPAWSSLRFNLLNTSIFTVNSLTGDITVLTPGVLDFESNSELTIQVKVTDGGFLTAQDTVYVSVLNEEEIPRVPVSYNLIVLENGAAPRSLLLVNATDPDRISQEKLSFSLVENVEEFAIDGITGELILLKPLDFEFIHSKNLTINVAKRETALNVNSTVHIVVADVNEPPELITGTSVDTAAQENTIDGLPIGASLSSYVWDPENNTLSYVLEASEYSPYFSLDGCTGQLRSKQPLDFETMPGQVNVTVSVYDSSKARLRFPVSVAVLDVNEPPVFHQSQYIHAVEENAASGTLVGVVAASDPDKGDQLLYFTKSGNNSTFKVDSATGEIFVSSTAMLDYETWTSYTTQVCATDSLLETCTGVLINIVNVNEPPSCQSEVRFAEENSQIGTVITPQFGSIDVDAKDLGSFPIFSLIDTEGVGGFRFDNASLVIQGLSLDYEVRDLYRFQFSACDAAGACSTCDLTIRVTDANENPIVFNQEVQVAEGTNGSFYSIRAYDPDLNQTGSLLYEILDQSLAGLFSVEPGSGLVSVAHPELLNFETVELHQAWINVRVTDNGIPPLSSIGHLVVQILDVNEVPTSVSILNVVVPENATIGTVILTWSVEEQDLGQLLTYQVMSGAYAGMISFRDNSSPDVTLEASLNYESLSQYEILLRSCDPYTMCTSTLLRIAVEDCNEPPSFFPNSNANLEFAVASHATSGTVIGILQAVDPDFGDVLSFSLVSSASIPTANVKDGAGVFSVNPQSGELTVASSQSIQQLQTGYSFMLTSRVADLKGLAVTTIIIVDVVANNAPPVCQTGLSVYMDENAPVGTLIGLPLSSYMTDADVGTAFVFSLQHPFLSVNPSSGQLFVTTGANLDFESSTLNTTTANVVVMDDGAYHNGLGTLATSCIVSVAATDINEAPQTTNLSLSITEGTNSNPSRVLPIEMFTFPILSPQDDYIIAKKTTGGYAVNSSRKTLPMGYDSFSRSAVGVVLRFGGVQLPDVIDHLSLAQLRFTVPSGKVGPFSIQIRVLNESSLSWGLNQPLENFGMPAFVSWTVEKELSATTIWSPSVTSLFVEVMPDILRTNNVALLITGGGIGEVSAFNRSAATAAVLEVTVAQVSRVSVTGGVVPYADPDALDSVQFAIVKGNPHNPVFFVDKDNGEITANVDLLDYEMQNGYELLISVTDKLSAAAFSTIKVAIVDANEPPVVNERVCYVAENTPAGSPICAISASDPDSSELATGKLVYYLAQTTYEDTTFQIDPISGMLLVANSTLLDFEERQKLVVTVCARDGGNPSLSGCGYSTVYVTDSNDAPTIISPQVCEMDEYLYDFTDEQLGRLVGMVVCNLTVLDEDYSGSINASWKNHVWQIVEADSGCPFILSSHGQIVASNPRFVNYEQQKSWSLLVQATDLGGLSSTPQKIEIIIHDINEKPQIDATTFFIDENSRAGTLATGSIMVFDPDVRSDGQPDTVIVSLVGQIDTFNVVNNKIQLEYGILDYETKSSYAISVVATDESGAKTNVQNINIVINNVNEVPAIEPMQVSILENQPATTKILPAVKANDPDGDSVSFSLVSETPSGGGTRAPTAFGIDALTGILFQQVDQLDYEKANEYALVVKARDSAGLFSTAIIAVTITDVNEAPSIRDQIISIREDASVGASVGQAFAIISSDPDMKNGLEVLTFTLTNASQSPFSIDSKSGQVITSARLDFETKSLYNLRVRVVDLNGLSDEADFVVTIIDVNEPPVIGPFTISVPENILPGSVLGDPIIAIDPDAGSSLEYDLSGTSDIVTACIRVNSTTGQLALKIDCSLDYESSTGNTLSVVVRASDGEFTVSTKGTVYITDVNEAPVLVASEATLMKENSLDETVVTLIMVQDPDINEFHQFWICEQSNSNTFRIQTIGVNTAEIIVKDSTVLNFEKNPWLWVDVCVKDKGNLTARSRYAINLVNVLEPSYFVQESIQFTVEESISVGSNIGSPLSRAVVDEENFNAVIGCSIQMSIMNSTCGRRASFSLDSCGQITLSTGELDYETMPTCVIYVLLPVTNIYNANTSSLPLADTIAVILTVTDVNEPPMFQQKLYQFGLAESTTEGTFVGVLAATDIDAGDVLSFQLLNAEAGYEGAFKVSASGEIPLATSLDFETKQSYQLSVRVLDRQGAYADSSVIISITDSNEPPVFQAYYYSFTIVENSPVQAVVGDVIAIDSDTYQNKTIIYSIISGNDLGAFAILSLAGDGKIVVSSQLALDYERQESFTLVVEATDSIQGGLRSFASVSVNIIDVNEAPQAYPVTVYIPEDAVIATAVCSSAALNETLTGRLFASDPDTTDTLTFAITDSTDTFAIDPTSGAVISKRLLNFESKSYYSISITATDRSNLSATAMVEIVVLDRNDAPIITSTAFTLAENQRRGSVIGVVQITDEDYAQQHFFTFVGTTLVLNDNSTEMRSGNDVVSIGLSSGSIQVVNESVFDYEAVRQVVMLVTVSDDGNPIRQTTGSLTLDLTNENEQCAFAEAVLTLSMPENVVGTAGQVLAVDPDEKASLSWGYLSYYMIDDEISSNAVSLSHTGQVLVKTPLDFETQRKIAFKVAAVDGGGLVCSGSVQLLVQDSNEPPVIQSGHYWVPESVDGNLDWVRADDGSHARISFWDPENDSVTLSQNSSDYFSISEEGLIALVKPVDYEAKSSYDLLAIGTDAYGLQTSAIVRIDLVDVNEPPIFATQPTLTIAEDASRGAVVGVVGAAYDPDEYDVVSYQLVAATDRNGQSVDIFMMHSCDGELRMSKSDALDYETNDRFVLTVSATDRAGLQAYSGPLIVEVSDVNEAPQCRDGILSIFENATTNERFGPIEWSDPDSPSKNNITVFEVISETDEIGYGTFEIQQSNDQYWIALQDSGSLDYESVNIYTVRIRIGDSFDSRHDPSAATVVSSLSATCTITIRVADVNEPPIVASVIKRKIEENSPLYAHVGLPIEANDLDAQDILHFSIVTDQDGPVPFTIDYNMGQLRVSGDLDYETQVLYTIDVAVEDSALNSVTTLVEVSVLDINERPQLSRNCLVREDGVIENRYEGNKDVCLEANEDIEVGSLLRYFEALDPDSNQRLFYAVSEVSNPFVRVVQNDDRSCELIYSRAIFDYESARMHRVQLTVTDTGKGFLSDTVMVFIFIVDVNEPPIILQASTLNLVIAENSLSGQLLGQLRGMDPEGDAFVFSLKDSSPIPTAIEIREDGKVLTTGTSVDFEALANMNSVWVEPVLTIRGTVTSLDAVSTSFSFIISVEDVPEPPSFGSEQYALAAHELASAGTLVGALQATDPDLNDTQQFTWDATDAATRAASSVFGINAKSGMISLLKKGVLDSETTPTYKLKALVTDSTGLTDSSTVVITIVNDNEPPICPSLQCWVLENSAGVFKGLPGTQGLCKVEVQDLDIGQKHTFQLLSTSDSRIFSIDYATGVVLFTSGQQIYANFEVQNIYHIRYQANDIPDTGLSLSCSNEIVISVVDVNEVPTILGKQLLAVAEMSAVGTIVGAVDGIDEDEGDVLTFNLQDSYSPFTLASDTGVLKVANASMINFESSSTMYVSVAVTDREGLQAVATIMVTVINVNDPPVLQSSNFTANEYASSKNGDASGARNLELLGSIRCFDEDSSDELHFSLLNDTSAFVIEAKSGMLYAETRYLDFETTRAYDLAIQCSDGQATAVSTFWGFVTNINEAPIVTGQVFRVDENTPMGTSIGFITVSDVERDDENFLTLVNAATGSTTVVSRLQGKTPVFSDSSDVEWMNIPEILQNAFIVTTPLSVPLSNATLNLASTGDIFVLIEDDSDAVPDWISQNAFVKWEEQTITAQSSTSATSYDIYIREKSGGDFVVPDTTAVNMLCVFGAYPSPLGYSIHGPRSDWFDVATSGELVLATATLDYDTIAAVDQPLQISVNVVDSQGLMGEATLSIYVDNVNEAPVITSCCFEITENPAIGTMIGELTGSDPDASDQIVFELAFPSTDISLTSSGILSVRNSSLFDFERNSLVTVRVRATDRGGLFHEREIQIKVLDVNEPPVFQQSSFSFGVPENSASGLNFGTPIRGIDPDRGQTETLRYELVNKNAGGLPFRLESCSGQLAVQWDKLDYEGTNQYSFGVRVINSGYPVALEAQVQVVVDILNVNEAPQFAESGSLVILENAPTGTLIGQIIASDPDQASVLTLRTNASDYVTITNSGGLYAAVSFDFETMPRLYVSITVEDNGVYCDPTLDVSNCEPISTIANVVVLVRNVNEPPYLTAGTFAIQENLSPGSLVGKPIQVVDVDGTVGNSFGFSIERNLSSGNESEFTIRGDGQLLTLVTVDFESKAEYKLVVAYCDGEFTAFLDITVSVLDENEPPSIVGGITGSVQENMAAGTTALVAQFSDPDQSSTNVFTLMDSYAPFKIDQLSGEVRTTRALDYEKDPTTFNLNIRVCDAIQTTLCGSGFVTVNVDDVPEAPSMDDITCTQVENTATVLAEQGTAACTFIASDPDKASCSFYSIVESNSQYQLVHNTIVNGLALTKTLNPTLCTSGRIGLAWKASSLPDYELLSQHVVTVRVSDETVKMTGFSVDSRVIVNVVNANDCPTLAPLSFTVRERSEAGTQIGYPLPGKDQDVADTLTYSILKTNATSGLIGIDAMTGQLTVARTPSGSDLVYPAQYVVTISVTDSSVSRCSTSSVIEILTTKSNFAPVWHSTLPASFDIYENSAVGTQAGALLSSLVEDPDNDVIQFTLQSKTDTFCADTFRLGLTSGAIVLREGSVLNFEQRRTYVCTVAACDPVQMCSTKDVTVQVMNVNEAPVFSDQLYTFVVQENQSPNFALPRCLTATDPDEGDGYALTYTTSCTNVTDCSFFSMKVEKDCSQERCARIIVKPSLNYEARRRYSFSLIAQDPGKLTAVTTIVIEVEDVNEVHSFVGFVTSKSVIENTAIGSVILRVNTKDPDIYSNPFRTIQYALSAVSPPGLNVFRIDSTTGDVIVNDLIDYETVQAYTLTIEARDSSGTNALAITKDLAVTVKNAEDTTVESFELVVDESRTLDTIGGEKFTLTGSNIGFKQRADGSVVIKQLIVQYGAYGATSPYTATNCSLVNGNTGVECTSAPGVGANLYWNITLVMSVPNIGDTTFQASSSVPLASYGSPVIDSVGCNTAFPANGSSVDNIFIYGQNLGSTQLISSDAQPVVLYGSDFKAQNFRGQASATFVTGCHYAAPIITAVTTSNGMQTSGSATVLVNGSGFGCQGCANITVWYTNSLHSFELNDCKVVVDHVQLACLSLPGAGADFRWQVSVDNQLSALTNTISTSYDLPEILEVMSFKDAPTAGGTVFQIRGQNFGPDTAIFVDPVLEYSFDNATILQAVQCKRKYTDPKNHNLIQCESVAGSGSFHSWRVTIEGQTSLWTTQNTSYAGPIVNKVFRPDGEAEIRTSGAQQVVITGKNFGIMNESVINRVTYGINGDEFTAMNCSIVIDHERILCATAPGVGKRLAWIVTIDGLTSATPTISYAKPFITSLDGEGEVNALVRGGQRVIIRGGNFGPSDVAIDMISYGSSGRDYQVTEVIEHNDSTIVCTTEPGVGANLSWIVSVGDQESSLSTATSSYAPPVVTSFYPSVALTDGSTQITIIGENLGANVTFAASRMMLSPPQASLSTRRIPTINFGDFGDTNTSEYVVVRIPVGYGSGGSLQLLVGTSSVQKSALLAISYGSPLVDSVYTDEGPSECLSSCIQLTITGTNFYTTGRVLISKYPITSSNLEAASYESSVEFSSWSHDTIIIPKYVGKLGYVTIVIGREKILSNSAPFSWDDPSILDWYTYSSTCGVLDCSTSYRLDGDTKLFQTEPIGTTGYLNYLSATNGGATLSLYAKYVGRNPRISIGASTCSNVVVTTPAIPSSVVLSGAISGVSSIRLISCTVPSGQGSMLTLIVTRGTTLSSPRYFSYIPPSVDWAGSSATLSPTTGKVVNLTGSNFGTNPIVSMTSSSNASVLLNITAFDHSHATVTIPAGEGQNYILKLVAGNQEKASTFSYNPPVISSIEVVDATTAGGSTMTIRGENFGTSTLSKEHTVLIGDAFSCIIDSIDHELILCTTSEGQGSGHDVVVTVSGQANADRARKFSYDAPVIYNISRSNGPTSGYTCSCTDPDQPCATMEAPVRCQYLESSSTSSSLDTYCVQTILNGVSQKVTVTAVEDVYSSNKPVYISDEETELQLVYTGGFWQLLQNDESLYRASTSTVSPPPTGWLDVTVIPPADVSTMKVYPGTCSKAASRACPTGTELCERVSVTLVGKNFGVRSLDWYLELASSDGMTEAVNVTNDDIVYFSHSNIKFNLPHGQRISRIVNLTVSELQLVNKSIEFGYQTPELIGYETSTSNLSTCGGYTITLYGKNFGSAQAKVLIGGRDARVDGQSSHPKACGSDTCAFSSSGPCIDIDTLVCYPSLYVVSPSFSFLDICDDTKRTQMMCEAVDPAPDLAENFTSHSDFVIETTVPAGYGADLEVYVIVDDQSSNALTFSYNQPVVTAQMPNQPDANGANAITIKGTDFGCFPNDAIAISFISTESVQPISRKLGTARSISELSTVFSDEAYRQLAETTSPANATNTSENSTGTIVWTSSSELVWYPPKTKAGITSIILSVGGNVMSASSQTQLKFQCSPGYYRTSTEFCDECPEGATCAGGDEMPLAKPGYWREGEVVLACDPMYACLGANKCAEGYADIRCGECETNYHKLNSECNSCPDNKWGSIAIGFICLGVASIVSYLLTRKGVSLGLLSIGIDYFQTLSIFGNARISWPSSLINLFSTLSAFNLNLELIAPECFSFQVSYENKWFIIELFPLVVGATSLGIFAALYAYKRFIKRRRTRLTSHLPQLFGSTLVMMYYLFLYLTRTTLDVFNCVGTIPSDGKLYMVAIYAQCFEPGGIHMQLFPYAVLAFVVYSLGYPLFVLLTLSRNRALVMEDQLLRAMQRGTSRRTNPNCWVFRKKFSKLYYQFKPDFWYWMVLIILRKFLLVGIGLLFRQDPVFQLATATFVLFVNYALQVRCRPYMSAYETQRVLADYAKRVLLETRRAKAKGEAFIQPAHLRLEMHSSTVTAWKSGHGDHGGSGVAGSSAPPMSGLRGANEAILASQEPQNLVGYLWDHNTVEACLLFSASLVLLAGVMFESGRLGSNETGFSSASAQMLAIATTILVVVSCVYFALVLITELVVALRPDYYKRITRVQKVFSSPRRHLKDDADADHEMVATMTQNPLHFNRALAGARGRAMRARERDALAALQDIQRRGSDPRRNSPQRQSEEGAPSEEDTVPRRRRSQRRRGTSATAEARSKRDEHLMGELTSAIEETDDVSRQRRATDD
ncbi:hypothetical protein PI125_g10068 [Phytophthora idaei]|nr:hypothetical protein PI125_g10068 [Phytophthora idaei]